jgi:hypothetical protein
VTLELTRGELKLYKGGALLVTVDVSREPVKNGGVYFYAYGDTIAELRNVRVKVLSR